MESEDYAFYQGLVFLLENNVKDLGYDLTFSTEVSLYIYNIEESISTQSIDLLLFVSPVNARLLDG